MDIYSDIVKFAGFRRKAASFKPGYRNVALGRIVGRRSGGR